MIIHIYIYTYICMYVCMYVCMYIYIYTHIHTCICIHVPYMCSIHVPKLSVLGAVLRPASALRLTRTCCRNGGSFIRNHWLNKP